MGTKKAGGLVKAYKIWARLILFGHAMCRLKFNHLVLLASVAVWEARCPGARVMAPKSGLPQPCCSNLSIFTETTYPGWWFQTFLIFNNIWDNPSHWLIFFRGVETTNQYLSEFFFPGVVFYSWNNPLVFGKVLAGHAIRSTWSMATNLLQAAPKRCQLGIPQLISFPTKMAGISNIFELTFSWSSSESHWVAITRDFLLFDVPNCRCREVHAMWLRCLHDWWGQGKLGLAAKDGDPVGLPSHRLQGWHWWHW